MTKVTHLTLDEGGGLNRRRIHLREISGDADTPLETVGQDLRAARLRRGDDLATVSRALKIRKDHLEALEEDRMEALPGRTYAVGFIRTYSDYLGLDAVQCVERFKGEIAGRESGPTPVSGLPAQEEERWLPHGWMIIAVVVLGLIVYGVWHLAVTADKMLSEPVAPVPAAMAPKPVVQTQPHVTQTVAQPAPAQAAPAPVTKTSTAPITPPVLLNGPQQQVQGQTASIAPAPLPQGQVYGAQNANARVVLHATAVTRVLVLGPDRTVYINRVLKPGDTYRVPDLVGLTLTTPDGGAVQVELDGQLMGLAGRPSQMTEALPLDPQAIVDRSNKPG
jgi:cytoskeleton protein RodZ